jgi:hypothetical protein
MPRRPLARAAWNYHLPIEQYERVTVTYNMNILQAEGADAIPAQPEPQRRRGPPQGARPLRLSSSGVHHGRGGRTEASATKSTGCAAPIIVAHTGATGFTRTASRARSLRRGIPAARQGRHMQSRIYKGWVEHRRLAPTEIASATACSCCTRPCGAAAAVRRRTLLVRPAPRARLVQTQRLPG